jgi:hypothetical protein
VDEAYSRFSLPPLFLLRARLAIGRNDIADNGNVG